MIGSDGLPHDIFPHPRLWGTFPRVLGHYSRDIGLFTLEEAVRKMTSLTAQTFGIKERGVIVEGNFADLVAAAFQLELNIMLLHIVRHGQTHWNVEGRIQGQLDSELDEIGIKQACQRGEDFTDTQFSAIYSSSSLRTRQTTEYLLANRTSHQANNHNGRS